MPSRAVGSQESTHLAGWASCFFYKKVLQKNLLIIVFQLIKNTYIWFQEF